MLYTCRGIIVSFDSCTIYVMIMTAEICGQQAVELSHLSVSLSISISLTVRTLKLFNVATKQFAINNFSLFVSIEQKVNPKTYYPIW